jgi:hypothetical protein
MPNSTSQAFANKLISLYLYGEETPPAQPLDEKYAGSRPFPDPVSISLSDFMAGPGRFMKLSYFELVQKFLNYNVDVSDNGDPDAAPIIENGKLVYTKSALGKRLGVDFIAYYFNQAYFDDGSSDYLDRVFIWGTTTFQLDEDIRFIVGENGERYIENANFTVG